MQRELSVVSDIVIFDVVKIRRLVRDESEIKQYG